MAKINFKNGLVEDYTIILSTRDHRHLGQITGIKSENVQSVNNLNSANEMSFSIYKYDFIKTKNYLSEEMHKQYMLVKEVLWNNIVDFKFIYVKELDEYFEIKVSIDDSKEICKTITATSACEAELSQTIIYNMEINTESDMLRDDYYKEFPTVFYRDPNDIEAYNNIWNNPDTYEQFIVYKSNSYETILTDDNGVILSDKNGITLYDDTAYNGIEGRILSDSNGVVLSDSNEIILSDSDKVIDKEATRLKRYNILKSSSLLHRALEKAPHYSIGKVDESLCNLQRTFSVSNSSIYDFLTGECAEQINCLFIFDSVNRSISVRDLYTTCKKEVEKTDEYGNTYKEICGYRGDFYKTCPECGNTDIKLMDYFGEDTTIYVDKNNLTDSIHLETNADSVKNCLRLVAGDELMTSTIRLLNQNGSDSLYYLSNFQIDDMPKHIAEKLNNYSTLYNSKTNEYQELVLNYYETIDHVLYLKSGMMPAPELGDVTAETEAKKLTVDNLSPMAISKISLGTSLETINSALKNYSKFLVKSGYVKIEISDTVEPQWIINKNEDGTIAVDSNGIHSGQWTGAFVVTNYSDKEDSVIPDVMTITVNDDQKTFVEQKVLKTISEDDDDGSIFDVLSITDFEKFKECLKYYSYNRLVSFHDAIEGALTVLQSMGITSPTPHTDDPTYDFNTAGMYEDLYLPYWDKLNACVDAMNAIQNDKNFEYTKKDSSGNDVEYKGCIESLTKKQEEYEKRISNIQDELNLEKYLGEDDYKIFCAYKREDTYENSNYISDGLDNAELIEKAKEFLELANKELVKSAETQYTISATLKNLLVLDEFKEIVDYFELGNWIRLKVDGELYERLRLISYSINFGSLQDLSVEFSTITQNEDMVYDLKQIIQSAQSVSSSFNYVAKQAEKGNTAQASIDSWTENGFNSGLIQLKNNENEEVTYGKTGILCRLYDDTTGKYSSEQLRFTHNILAYTDDDWKTTKTVLGKHKYKYYNKDIDDWNVETNYGLTTEFVTSGYVSGSTIVGGTIYSSNYCSGKNTDGKPAAGSWIDLDKGHFSFAAGGFTYDGENLALERTVISDAVQDINITAENLKIKAENIDGYIDTAKIKGTDSNGLIVSDMIKSLPFDKIEGAILESQISDIPVSKLSGDIHAKTADTANSVSANNISGTVESSKIATNLTNKNITGTFEGSVELSSVTTVDNGKTYNTVSGEFTVGNMTLKFVNGLLVSAV